MIRTPKYTFTLFLLLSLSVLAVVTGCGKSTPTVTAPSTETSALATTASTSTSAPTEQPSATPMPTDAPTPTPNLGVLNPLTGQNTMNPDAAGKRPVGVMFSNIQAALPQCGITSADVYYEMVVESGITRIMALFADAAAIPEIGSIRSARNDFVDMAMGHDALLVHFGASILCWDYMAAKGIATLDWQFYSKGYWRDPAIAAAKGSEHSVKSNAALIVAAIAGKGMRATLSAEAVPAFAFSAPDQFIPASGSDCTFLSVPFTNSAVSPTAGFRYNEALKTYEKSQFGSLQIDVLTGEPIRVTNAFVLFTTIYALDSGGHVGARLSEGGTGYYLSGGKVQEIQWTKPGLYKPFVYKAADGSPLTINTGKTYVCVVSKTQQAKVVIN